MQLTQDQAREIAQQNDLGEVNDMRNFTRGIRNFNYLVSTSQGKYVIRIYGEKFSDITTITDSLEFKVLDYLPKQGFSHQIPVPRMNKSGDIVQQINGQFYYVYPYIEGENIEAEELNVKKVGSLGRTLGELHRATRDLPGNPGKVECFLTSRLQALFESIRDYTGNGELAQKAKEASPLFLDMLNRLKEYSFSSGVLPVHGDFSYDNVVWKGDEVIGVIDFEAARFAPRVIDITRNLFDNCLSPIENAQNYIRENIRSYNEVFQLDDEERAHIFPLLLLRSCDPFRIAIENKKITPEKRLRNIRKAVRRATYFLENERNIDKLLIE